MEFIGGILVFSSLAGIVLSLIALIRPIRKIGLGRRWRSSLALAASVIAFFVGAALLPPAPEAEPAATATDTPNPAQAAAPPSGRLANVDPEEVRRDLQPLLDRLSNGALYPGVPNPKIIRCGDDDTLCQMDQLTLLREWKAAHEGDYGAQRNVAFCYRASAGCGIVPDRVQACAWRAVIIDAADPEMHEGDVSNFETDCGQLSQAGRVAADAQAARIKGLISRART